MGIQASGFRIQDSEFEIQDLGFGIRDLGFGIRSSRFLIQDSAFRIGDLGFGIRDSGIWGGNIAFGGPGQRGGEKTSSAEIVAIFFPCTVLRRGCWVHKICGTESFRCHSSLGSWPLEIHMTQRIRQEGGGRVLCRAFVCPVRFLSAACLLAIPVVVQ